MRLIRSKGVGVYFVTQNPLDIPETVLGQLGNRVQHALRAFTPRDQKAVKAAAETMRANPKLDTEKVITELGVGEALVSFLDEKGRPGIVERAYILPPASRIGPATPEERRRVMASSTLAGVYDKAVDRESAYERLKGRVEAASAAAGAAPPGGAPAAGGRKLDRLDQGLAGRTGLRQRPQGQHRRGGGEERGANGRLDDRPRDRPRRAGLAARRAPALACRWLARCHAACSQPRARNPLSSSRTCAHFRFAASSRMSTADKNVLGGVLAPCSTSPRTGFYRDGCCNTGPEDVGLHVVCAQVTAEFLAFARAQGNDLVTPVPAFGFPGLVARRPLVRMRSHVASSLRRGRRAAGGPRGDERGNARGDPAFGADAARARRPLTDSRCARCASTVTGRRTCSTSRTSPIRRPGRAKRSCASVRRASIPSTGRSARDTCA